MKAIVYKEYGSPDVLHSAEIEEPSSKDNELLIRVRTVEATKADCEIRSFNFPVKWFWLPLRLLLEVRKPKRQVLGGYFAGEVESVGRNVTKFQAGNAVFGSSQLRLGAYGEYMCVPETYTIVTTPSDMSFEEAAAVPLGDLNARHFMRRADIRRGERVLINGAGESLAHLACRLPKPWELK